jgi:cytochrome P450
MFDGRTVQVTTHAHMTFDDEYYAAPEMVMHQLAEQGPIHRFSAPQGIGGWMITSYELAREVFTHPHVVKTPETMNGSYVPDTTNLSRRSRFNRWANAHLITHMLGSEPPDHDRLRAVVAEPFSPRALAARAPRITRLADDLLDRMSSTGTVDLSAAFAVPLPVQIAAEITGVPIKHADTITRSSAALGDFLTSSLPELRNGVIDYARMIAPLMVARRFAPRDDILSTLAAAHRRGEISFREATSTASIILLAGHEAVTSMILTTVFALLTHPAEMARVREDPKSLDAVIEEALRVYTPQPVATLRVATAPLTLAGQDIRAGDWIWISLLAAGYDSRANECPHAFDSGRKPRRALPFGHGIHYCLGAPLARMLTRIAVTRLLDRYPDLALTIGADEMRWRRAIFFRRIVEMPVSLR